MERKVITSMLTGYLISMLPVWEIGSRIQAIMLTLAISVCAFIFMLWIEDIFENIKKDSHVGRRGSQKEKTTFVNSIRNLKRNVKEDYMLKTDFNGYKEFKEKLANTSGEENAKVCMERIQMWTNKFTDMINPLPAGDTAFVIVALETIAKTLRGGRAEENFLADMLKIIIGAESKTTTVKGDANTTEAAVRTYAESLKK